MSECVYHPIYRVCRNCGHEMQREETRVCQAAAAPLSLADRIDRITALRETRALIKDHAVRTWKLGLTERSDGITEVLVDFDLKFPEARDT